MGADRRGPLAAFVVIAIIAAVLLVTSVRSQAAPGWLDPDNLPATIVAAPPATDPHLWLSVTSSIPQAVQHGVVIVKRVASGPGDGQEPATLTASSASPASPEPTSTAGGQPASPPASEPAPPSSTQGHGHEPGPGHAQGHGHHHGHGHAHGHGHGRHLGWSKHGS